MALSTNRVCDNFHIWQKSASECRERLSDLLLVKPFCLVQRKTEMMLGLIKLLDVTASPLLLHYNYFLLDGLWSCDIKRTTACTDMT
jgi:hypothetical protein